MGDASADILTDDDRVSLSSSGMQFRKVSKLLPYPGEEHYHFEGEEVVRSCWLLHAVTELGRMRSFIKLNKTDVVFSTSKTEDL